MSAPKPHDGHVEDSAKSDHVLFFARADQQQTRIDFEC
jgi:hypothetical protein